MDPVRHNPWGQPVGEDVPAWSPRRPVRAVALAGRYVRLEPLSLSHAQALLGALCGPHDEPLWTYRTHPMPTSLAAMRSLLEAHLETPDLETVVLLPAEGPAPDAPAGMVSCTRVEPAHGQVELAGVLYARHLQRTRAATEAIHLLMSHAFDTLGYRRVEWKCDRLNEPSRRAADRLGFTLEGRFRQHQVTHGRNRDTDWFSVLDCEWPMVGAAQRAWLDPTAFDERGVQRSALRARPNRDDLDPAGRPASTGPTH